MLLIFQTFPKNYRPSSSPPHQFSLLIVSLFFFQISSLAGIVSFSVEVLGPGLCLHCESFSFLVSFSRFAGFTQDSTCPFPMMGFLSVSPQLLMGDHGFCLLGLGGIFSCP